jgi:hypothetical protein
MAVKMAQLGLNCVTPINKTLLFVKYRLLPESQTPEISVNVQEDRCHAVAATTAPFRRRMAVDFARRGRSPGRPGKQP